MDEYDAPAARAKVTFERASLWVDVSKVSGADAHRVGSTYQYIGEVDSSGVGAGPGRGPGGEVVLRARVARCVDGLDVGLYHLSLHERKLFLQPPRPGHGHNFKSKTQPPPV